MANKRVKDLTTDTSLSAGDYVLLDSASEGTRKFDLGTELNNLKSDLNGWSDDTKTALLNCFAHVAWTDEHGQDYYDALEEALYAEEPKTLVSISAVYTQSGTVYDTDSLDSLKSDLVVTATYDDSTTAVVTSYTLSGTLTVGTSTITVTYEDKTTTFNVTVSIGWRYTASKGLLKDQSFITYSAGTLAHTETVVDDYLKITVAASTAATNNQGFTFVPSTYSGDTTLKLVFRINQIGWTNSNTSVGQMTFRLGSENGGTHMGFIRVGSSGSANVKLCYYVGNTLIQTQNVSTETWHTLTVTIANGKQSIKLDDTDVLTEANLSTSYSTANRMYLFGNNTSNGLNVDIKELEYTEAAS